MVCFHFLFIIDKPLHHFVMEYTNGQSDYIYKEAYYVDNEMNVHKGSLDVHGPCCYSCPISEELIEKFSYKEYEDKIFSYEMAILKEIRKTWPKEVTKMIKYKGYYRDFSISEMIIYSDGEESPKKMLKQSIQNEYKEYLDKSISIEDSMDMMDLENMMYILQTSSIYNIYIIFFLFLLFIFN